MSLTMFSGDHYWFHHIHLISYFGVLLILVLRPLFLFMLIPSFHSVSCLQVLAGHDGDSQMYTPCLECNATSRNKYLLNIYSLMSISITSITNPKPNA